MTHFPYQGIFTVLCFAAEYEFSHPAVRCWFAQKPSTSHVCWGSTCDSLTGKWCHCLAAMLLLCTVSAVCCLLHTITHTHTHTLTQSESGACFLEALNLLVKLNEGDPSHIKELWAKTSETNQDVGVKSLKNSTHFPTLKDCVCINKFPGLMLWNLKLLVVLNIKCGTSLWLSAHGNLYNSLLSIFNFNHKLLISSILK